MISDKNIFFYSIGTVLVVPILIGIVYSILDSLGIGNPLVYAIFGTLGFIWVAVWIYSFIDDVSGHVGN